MAFNPNIPNPTDYLSASQPIFKANNQSLDNVFFKNHFKFSDGSTNAGKHRFVEMVATTLPGGLTTGESTLFVKTIGGRTELVFTNENSGKEYQLTSVSTSNYSTFGNITGPNSSGWSFLPGGLLIMWGNRALASAGNRTTVTFPRAFGAAPFTITTGYQTDEGSNPSANNCMVDFSAGNAPSTTQFKLVNSSGSADRRAYWIAIGPA